MMNFKPDLKLGKTPARRGAATFKLRQYVGLDLTPPRHYGHQKILMEWGMLGNDLWGDCVLAGAGHETMIWNKEANKIVAISDTNALSDYSAITGFTPNDPSTDRGTDMEEAAKYRRQTGVVDAQQKRHKIYAYLAITPGNTLQLKQAIWLFSAVGIGFAFPAYAMDRFNAGKPWSIQRTNTDIDGGHYVPAIGYDTDYIYVITWGRVQKMSWAFYKKYCDEALAYLSLEYLTDNKNPEGVDIAKLKADIAAL